MGFLGIIGKIGDGISWITQKVIHQIATWGINMTELQTKILLIIIYLGVVVLFLTVISFTRKILKWILIVLVIFLTVSVAVSIFV